MKRPFAYILALFIFSACSAAWALELRHHTSVLYLQKRSGWTLSKDLFGIPFVYFSPQENGQRSNISFTETGAELELDVKSLQGGQETYQEGKKKWALAVKAQPLAFLPYEMKINKYGHKIHKIGFSYQHEKQEYAETSHYIECRGKVYFSKSLRLKKNEQHETVFADLLNSLDCGGV